MEESEEESAGGNELPGVGGMPRPSDAGKADRPWSTAPPFASAEVRPRWRRPLIAAFVVADVLLLAAFVWSGYDDARIGREGHRVDATVVEITDGYAEVEFDVGGRPVTVEINTTGARPPITHEGQPVTIALDPDGGSATPADVSSNDLLVENLLIGILVIIGFDAVVLCVVAVCVALDRRLRGGDDTRGSAGPPRVTGDRLEVPLRCWGIVARSLIEVTPGHLFIHLPRYFGRQPVAVNLTEVAVFDGSTEAGAWFEEEGDALPERDAVIPSFPTLMAMDEPNLTLLFDPPVRIPRLRWFTELNGVTGRSSRRPEGARIDGMAVTATDPEAAIELLRSLGVPTVDDPIRWMIVTFGELSDSPHSP